MVATGKSSLRVIFILSSDWLSVKHFNEHATH